MDGHVVGGPGWPVHAVRSTVLVSSVTAPVRANVRPNTRAPVVNVMLTCARMLPMKAVPVPSVAELPTCQKTLQLGALAMNSTRAFDEVVSVLPVLKINTGLGLLDALSVSVPVNWADDEKQ